MVPLPPGSVDAVINRWSHEHATGRSRWKGRQAARWRQGFSTDLDTDNWARWLPPARATAFRLDQRHDFGAVVAFPPPWVAVAVALDLATEADIFLRVVATELTAQDPEGLPWYHAAAQAHGGPGTWAPAKTEQLAAQVIEACHD